MLGNLRLLKPKTLAIPLVFALIPVAANAGQGHGSPANLSRLVVVGDSLSAGVQNFSLLDSQQKHGYASVIAGQAEHCSSFRSCHTRAPPTFSN
jgi:hypothetical protein